MAVIEKKEVSVFNTGEVAQGDIISLNGDNGLYRALVTKVDSFELTAINLRLLEDNGEVSKFELNPEEAQSIDMKVLLRQELEENSIETVDV